MPPSMPFPMPPPVIGSIILAPSPTTAMPWPTDFLIGGALQEGLEPGPAADLALVAVGGDDAFRLDVHFLLEALCADPADPAVVFDDRRRGGLEPNVRALLRGFLRHGLVESVSLKDDSHFVARMGLFNRQLRAVRREDLRALDLPADPFSVERQFRVFDEMTRKALATAHRRADLLPFLNEERAAAAHCRVAGRHRAGWTCADHHNVVLVRGHRLARPFIGTGYIRVSVKSVACNCSGQFPSRYAQETSWTATGISHVERCRSQHGR